MGVCGSALSTQDHATKERERRINKIITTTQDKDKETEVEVLKLLLLGTGESGKSTLFKQVIQLYGKGFSDEARAPYASIVYANTIASMKTLILQSEKLCKIYEETAYHPDLKESARYVNELKLEDEVDTITAQHVKKLWADSGIQKTYTKRSMFQLTDACQWFFDRLDAIGQDNYLPSYDDILRCRARTTGIVETSFTLEGNKFRMLDVGGQRNERKKWFHCFEAVTAVIFVAAINEYDQVLYEDGKTNRIHESLTLFGEICNSRWFHKTSMILFLNKNDLFKVKIETVDMKCCFENYEGGCNYDEAALFLTEQFMAKNDYPHKKKIYVHITCATNTKNIAFTFNVVKDIIVKNGLKECGLLV